MRMTGNFAQLLHAFFYEWLAGQRNNSRHTVRSYRDTWRLFLRFTAARQQRPVAALHLADLTATEVLAFLDHSEKERHVSIGTRNCRLAALRSFFCFVADREPLAAGQCAEVLRIPIKRGPRRRISYLDSAEVAAILAEPDRQTLEGQRDHALLALLYNTGARIQEALDLCPQAVRLESPAQVRLVGKGRKERLCPSGVVGSAFTTPTTGFERNDLCQSLRATAGRFGFSLSVATVCPGRRKKGAHTCGEKGIAASV